MNGCDDAARLVAYAAARGEGCLNQELARILDAINRSSREGGPLLLAGTVRS